MKFHIQGLLACGLAAALAACGGGGGSGAANTAEGAWLSFDPAAPSVIQYQGDSVPVQIKASSSRTFTQPFNVGIIDAKGVVTTQVSVVAESQMAYVATLNTSASLGVGTYTTSLEVRVCEDAPLTCAKPFPGSPWRVPLTVTVKPATNLSALKAVDGLAAWSTYQGNAAHTGFANASFDPSVFTRRWQLPSSSSSYSNNFASAAIDNGRAFFVRHGASNRWELVALSEDSGAQVWKVDLGNLTQVNPPAAANGRVYLTSSGHEDTFMWVYDQASGALLRQTAMSSQWPSYSAPTVFGTDVYSISGYYGGMLKYSDQSGKISWNVALRASEGWSPATDGRFVYSYSTPDKIFTALNAADGSLAYTVGPSYGLSTIFSASQVVLTDSQQAIVAAGQLMAFDLATRTRAWALDTPTSGIAAYGNGTVYAFGANGRTLEARAPATGNLLWTADLGANNYGNVVVTRNLAFVSSPSTTQAIDLSTRKVVWTYALGGSLAVSERGVLYILTNIGALAAINLR